MHRSLIAVTALMLASAGASSAHAETQSNPAETSVLEVEVVKRTPARVIYDREFYFAAGSANIDIHGRRTLREVRDLLAKSNDRKVVIEGFSDASGTAHSIVTACANRTDAAFLELLILGADKSQLLRKVRGMRKLDGKKTLLPRKEQVSYQRAVRVRVVEL